MEDSRIFCGLHSDILLTASEVSEIYAQFFVFCGVIYYVVVEFVEWCSLFTFSVFSRFEDDIFWRTLEVFPGSDFNLTPGVVFSFIINVKVISSREESWYNLEKSARAYWMVLVLVDMITSKTPLFSSDLNSFLKHNENSFF